MLGTARICILPISITSRHTPKGQRSPEPKLPAAEPTTQAVSNRWLSPKQAGLRQPSTRPPSRARPRMSARAPAGVRARRVPALKPTLVPR